MDTLIWFFFESSLALGGCLVVVLFVLLVHWRRTLKPRAFLIGLAVSVALLLMQALVVTRYEHADHIMKGIEVDVVASRPDAIAAALCDRFHIAEMDWDREDFLARVRRYMEAVDVRTLRQRALSITASEDDTFRISISYLADVSTRDFNGLVLSRWRISFVREGGDWRILSIEPTELNHRAVRGWRNLDRR